jgi:hypothetical protein
MRSIEVEEASMNRQMWVVAFVTVALTTATLAAQTAGTSGSREQSPSGNVTLTGCLQKGSGSSSATGTSGTGTTSTPPSSTPSSSSSSSSSGQFILTNAQMGSGSSSRSSTSGTSGTSTSERSTTGGGTSSSSASSSGSRYILDGQESELSKHVGEKVEITGSLASSSSGSSSGTSGTSGTSSTTGGASSSMGQHVRVQSVKTISSSCSQ